MLQIWPNLKKNKISQCHKTFHLKDSRAQFIPLAMFRQHHTPWHTKKKRKNESIQQTQMNTNKEETNGAFRPLSW